MNNISSPASVKSVCAANKVTVFNRSSPSRANAAAAVQAALDSTTNQNLTWPDRVSNVAVVGGTLRWTRGAETKNMLVVQADDLFGWTPTDGNAYEVEVTDYH